MKFRDLINEAYDKAPKSEEEIEKLNHKKKDEILKLYRYLVKNGASDPIVVDEKNNTVKIKRIYGDKFNLDSISKELGLSISLAFGDGSSKSSEAKQITFAGGDNTAMGESLQIAGLFMSDSDLAKPLKPLIKLLKSLPLSNGSGAIEKYLKTEELFDAYSASLYSILKAATIAGKELKAHVNYNKVIHSDINKYYALLKSRGDVTSMPKENTADCVLYNGADLLTVLSDVNNKIEFSDYKTKVVDKNGKVLTEFIQVSLKASGRIGDIATFTQISNNHKYFIYEGFGDYLKSLVKGAKNTFKGALNAIKNSVSKAMSMLKVLGKTSDDIQMRLFYDNNLTEAKKGGLPKEEDIQKKFGVPENYKILKNKVDNGLKNLKSVLDKMGDGVIYNFPNYSAPNNPPAADELRLIYFNAVSIYTLLEYLNGLSSTSDFSNVEIEMMYGNTNLPLVKVFADPSNPIEYLPIEVKQGTSSNIPSFAVKINETKSYLSFYIFMLSVTHTEEPTYIKIQMRTKGNQYVVDGQSLINYNQFTKAMDI